MSRDLDLSQFGTGLGPRVLWLFRQQVSSRFVKVEGRARVRARVGQSGTWGTCHLGTDH